MRRNSNHRQNKQQLGNHNVGASRNPQLASNHSPMKNQYQFITQQDQSQRQMLEVYTQPLENSRAHTPTQSMRGTKLQNASPPMTTDINKLYDIFKAQQQIALNGLKSRSNSSSRSRSKNTRDHKENKEYALLKSKKIYDKMSSSQQWSETKSDTDVKKQVLEFLQWQEKQASSNNHHQYDMINMLNYSSLRQLLPNNDRDEDLSSKYSQKLNDKEHFSSILEKIEFPSKIKRSMNDAKVKWREPQVHESAVFQTNNLLIVNQTPASHSVIVSQASNQLQKLASKAKHSVNDYKKQTEGTIMRDSSIINKNSNGNSTMVAEMQGQNGWYPAPTNINSSIEGSIILEQPFQNNRGSYQKRSPV